MKKVLFTIGVMSVLLTACGNSDTTDEKAPLKADTNTEDVVKDTDSTQDTPDADNEVAGTDKAAENNDEPTSAKEVVKDTSNGATIAPANASTSTKKETPPTPSPATPAKESLKQQYLKKLESTKIEAENQGVSTDTSDQALTQLEYKRYQTWDNLLNEIYGVLKTQLSASEMEQLKIKQREWITYRDKKAGEASYMFHGGTAESLVYTGELANQTEKRCYELVNNYMK